MTALPPTPAQPEVPAPQQLDGPGAADAQAVPQFAEASPHPETPQYVETPQYAGAPQYAAPQPYDASQQFAQAPQFNASGYPTGAQQYTAKPLPVNTTVKDTNTYALVSIIITFLAPIAGIVFGHLALNQIKRTGDAGRGMALTAVIYGYVVAVLGTFFVISYLGFILYMLSVVTPGGYYY